MISYLLDTNIVIFALRRRGESMRAKLNRHDGRIAVSTITVTELIFGAERSVDPDRNTRAVEEILDHLTVLPFDTEAAQQAGEIRATLTTAGVPIGPYDVLIAGHARANGLILVTNNRTEFDRVDGLRIEDWSSD